MLNAILIVLGLYFAACYAWGVYIAIHLSTGRPIRHLFRGKLDVHATPRRVTRVAQPPRYGTTASHAAPTTHVTTGHEADDDRAAA